MVGIVEFRLHSVSGSEPFMPSIDKNQVFSSNLPGEIQCSQTEET